jgi:3-dehydroquinate synthase
VKLDKTDFVRLIQIMKTDKKNRGDEINFTLLQDIGKPLFNQSVNAAEIERALMRYRAI